MSGGTSTTTNPFIKEPNISRPKIAPHPVSGWVPVESKFQQQKEEFSKLNLSHYTGGLPYKGIFTRRNNPEALDRFREMTTSPNTNFQTRYNVAHPRFPLVDYTSAALNMTTSRK